MKWTIAKAKNKFSELIRNAQKEPQLVYNRDKLIAAIISAEEYNEIQSIKVKEQKKTLLDFFNEFKDACIKEHYTLEIPKRINRKDQF